VSGATTASLGNYNPFAGSGFTQVPVTLTLTRYNADNGKTTRRVDFYISRPLGSPAGFDVRYQGSSVLYTQPTTHPLSLGSPPSGTIFNDFGGNAKADSVSLALQVTVPPATDLTAGAPVTFDIVYICDGQGGLLSVSTPATLANAITVQINVLSALQASYAGPALNFGEVGSLADAQASTVTVAGVVRVASSGPYSVALASVNGYRMTYPGGNPATPSQAIKYSTHFLGQTVDSSTGGFSSVVCSRAGTGGQNLPVSATLEEGGRAKTPSPSYQDTLTITVTPLTVPYNGGTSPCPSL